MKSILWLCDERGSECDNISHQIAKALFERFPLEYTAPRFAYYSDPPHAIKAWIRETDIIMCSHPAALKLLKRLNVEKQTVLHFNITEPNLVLDELIRDDKITAASGSKAGDRKKRKKTPPQLLKEARERQAVKELAKNPDITSEQLGKILGCHKSTAVRLKAWQKKNVLNNPLPKGFIKRTGDENDSIVEAINEPE